MAELERTHSLNEEEQRLVFERRLQIFTQIQRRREENKKLSLEPTISDTWNPQQREKFSRDWLDNSDIVEAMRGEKHTHEGALQTGRGDDNERPLYIESVTQANTKKFRTKAMNYRAQFTNALANVEITSLE